MELQKFIREHDNWETLLAEPPYSLVIKRKGELVMFNYNLLASDMSNPIVRECRGLILEEGTWKVVCRGMDKFSNAHESDSDLDKIDWSTARVQEKVDGTLILVWSYGGQWHVSTRKNIDAREAPLNIGGFETYYDLFIEAVHKSLGSEADFFDILSPTYTYWFELVSPYNRIVVPYEETKLYFLGWRWNEVPYEERNPLDSAMSYYFDVPKTYPLHSYNEVYEVTTKMDWRKEGFVVCDSQFRRIKMKSFGYLAAHYLVNNGVQTDARLVDIIRLGEASEFCSYCPQYSARLQDIQSFMEEYALEAEAYAHSYIYNAEQQGWSRGEYAKRAKRDNDWCFDYLMWTYNQVNGYPHGDAGSGNYEFSNYENKKMKSSDWAKLYKEQRG